MKTHQRTSNHKPDSPPPVTGIPHQNRNCPSCGRVGQFVFIGTQAWPLEVARRLNCSTNVGLWRCETCHTTVSELSFD